MTIQARNACETWQRACNLVEKPFLGKGGTAVPFVLSR